MQRVFRGSSLVEVGHLKNLLEHAGVRSMIKNEHLASALGDIPFLECQPELWVIDDAQAARARALIEESFAAPPDTTQSAWLCGHCGEANEAQFAACWRCGASDRRQ
jgi:hypothetical protein